MAAAHNLGILMRSLFGIGTPRSMQGIRGAVSATLGILWTILGATKTRLARTVHKKSNTFDILLLCTLRYRLPAMITMRPKSWFIQRAVRHRTWLFK